MLVIMAGVDQKERYMSTLLFTCPLCATTGAVWFVVQKTSDLPQLQLINKVVDSPVVPQRSFFMVQTVWMTMEILRWSMSLFLQVVRVPQVQVAKMTVGIPQLHLVENIALLPDLRVVLVTQASVSLGTASGGPAHGPGCRHARWRFRSCCPMASGSRSWHRATDHGGLMEFSQFLDRWQLIDVMS